MKYRLIGEFAIEAANPGVSQAAKWCEAAFNELDVNLVRFVPRMREVLGTLEFQCKLTEEDHNRIAFDLFPNMVSDMRKRFGTALLSLELELI